MTSNSNNTMNNNNMNSNSYNSSINYCPSW